MSLLSVPLKSIVGYYARTASEALPSADWVACDGTTVAAGSHNITVGLDGGGGYPTPDLRNRYLIGADRTRTSTPTARGDTAGDAPSVKETGGANHITVATANLPVHGHTSTTAAGGAHTHVVSTSSDGDHNHTNSYLQGVDNIGSLTRTGALLDIDCVSATTAASDTSWNDHTHTIGNPTAETATHPAAHTISLLTARQSGVAAGGAPYDARPRSHSVVWIMKVRQ